MHTVSTVATTTTVTINLIKKAPHMSWKQIVAMMTNHHHCHIKNSRTQARSPSSASVQTTPLGRKGHSTRKKWDSTSKKTTKQSNESVKSPIKERE